MTASTLAWLTGRITLVRHSALMACINAVVTVVCAAWGWTTTAALSAASTAMYAWLWWHGGGGDGTKRRLKSWARRFQGVRRTAPSGA
jgi:hypothetical protein